MANTPLRREELKKAIGKIKYRKAGGSSGILPEMVKAKIVLFIKLIQVTFSDSGYP